MRDRLFYLLLAIAFSLLIIAMTKSRKRVGRKRTRRQKNFQNGGGPRVIIFQFETRNDKYLNAYMNDVKKYAEKHGYEYIRPTDNTISPYWKKVKLVLDKLASTDENTIIAWIDSDSYIAKKDMKIEDFVKEHGSVAFLGSKDIPDWQPGKDSFNAGNFFVVNKPIAKEMFADWFALYNPADWKWDDAKKSFVTKMVYAGDAYEQGSFQKKILIVPKYAAEIRLLDADVLNNYRRECDKNPGTFVCQFISTPSSTGQNGKANLGPFACDKGLLPCDLSKR